jgi:lysozyme family protein
VRYSLKWPEYKAQWDDMKINASRQTEFDHLAMFAIGHRAQYITIEGNSGVPWAMIACLHRRESDADFTTYLGNGDPLNKKTRHVPKGRGPFASFEEGAADSLKLDGLTTVRDWRLEKVLYYCELFNGGGYASRGLPSPYVWGGTSVQRPGKYVADGQWNPSAWDGQPGVAPMLKTIMRLDPSVEFERED